MEIMKNWSTVLLLVLGLTAVALLTFLAAQPELRERELRDGLRGAADLLDATAAAAGPGAVISPDPYGPDPFTGTAAGTEHDSLLDLGRGRQGVEYDCGEGIHLRYGLAVDLGAGRRGEEFLRGAERFWRARGHEVYSDPDNPAGLYVQTSSGDYLYTVFVPRGGDDTHLRASTDACAYTG